MPTRRSKKSTAPDKKTYVALVLDASGSMQSVKRETIDGFNKQAAAIRENAALGGKTFVSFFTFGEAPDGVNPQTLSVASLVQRFPQRMGGLADCGRLASMYPPKTKFLNEPAEKLRDLSPDTYRPYGDTPMLDGIGHALTELEQYDVEGAAFLVTIITDGEENMSSKWDGPKLAAKIKQLEARGNWTITLIGANVDIAAIKQQTGIAQAVAFRSDRVGTQTMNESVSYGTQSYFASRGMGATASAGMYGNEANLSDEGAAGRLQARAQADLANVKLSTPPVAWKVDKDEDDDNNLA